MDFEILGSLSEAETFAIDSATREIQRLRRVYGKGRWRKRKGLASVRLRDGTVHRAEAHWYESTGIGNLNSKSNAMLTKPRPKSSSNRRGRGFVVCIQTDGYEVSLEATKLYEVVPDAVAEKDHQVRIIDESGEDYLFPENLFATIDLPRPFDVRCFKPSNETLQ